MAALLTACSSGYVEDDYTNEPREYVPEQRVPTQDQIDRSFEEDLRKSETEVDFNVTECVDVTSYDYDWSNDMRCTRPDGSVFYTDYEGAAAQEGYDPDAACRDDGNKADTDVAKFMREHGYCD
jgi:hypothetical protein